MTLAKTVVHNSAWSMASVMGDRIIGFIIFLILARLLAPEQFGLVALAAIVIDICLVLARCGVGDAIVRRKRLPGFLADTAFILSAAFGTLFTLGCFVAAPYLASWYKAPELESLIKALSLTFIIIGFGTVNESMLVREFGFKTLALRNLAGTLLSGVVGVGMAFYGYGVWSLVAQRLVATLWSTVAVWLTFAWRPKLRFSKKGAKQLMHFGGLLSSSNLIWTINSRVHELIVGFFLGPQAVGFFRIAWRGLEMVLQVSISPIVRVSFATFSKLQADPEKFRNAYTRFVMVAGMMTFPVFLGSAVIAPELVVTVFGPQWETSGNIMRILCLLVVPVTLNNFMSPAFAAVNRPGQLNKMAIVTLLSGIVLTVIAVPYGIEAIAIAHTARSYIILPYAMYLTKKYTQVPQMANLTALAPSAAASGLMMVVIIIVRAVLPETLPNILNLAITVSTGAVVYTLSIIYIGRKYMRPFFSSMSSILPGPLGRISTKVFA